MKTSVKIILLSLVETIILSAMVCTMIYSINESNHCTYAIFHYDGYATIANDITDFHGEKYPAGTSFRIKRIYENGKHYNDDDTSIGTYLFLAIFLSIIALIVNIF